jgi:hypothetical protein
MRSHSHAHAHEVGARFHKCSLSPQGSGDRRSFSRAAKDNRRRGAVAYISPDCAYRNETSIAAGSSLSAKRRLQTRAERPPGVSERRTLRRPFAHLARHDVAHRALHIPKSIARIDRPATTSISRRCSGRDPGREHGSALHQGWARRRPPRANRLDVGSELSRRDRREVRRSRPGRQRAASLARFGGAPAIAPTIAIEVGWARSGGARRGRVVLRRAQIRTRIARHS